MSMSEASFSCTFKLFNQHGEVEQFTVRGDTYQQFVDNRNALNVFIQQSYGWQPPKEGDKPKTEQIAGYVVGETKTGTVCVYLYKPQLKYREYVLYPEDKHLFPAPWPGKSEWPGSAPEQEDAVRRGFFHPLVFDLPVVPDLDENGEPKKKESGRIKYKPHRHFTASTATVQSNSTTATSTVAAQSKTTGTVHYVHRRKLPDVGKYTTDQIGSASSIEPEHNGWWDSFTPAEQDALMYGRTFVLSYKKSTASQHGETIWNSIVGALSDKCKLGKDIVRIYAHYILSDMALAKDEKPLTGVVQWLAECSMEKKSNGDVNPNYDPDWMAAFAILVAKAYEADDLTKDDGVPFNFASGDAFEMPF